VLLAWVTSYIARCYTCKVANAYPSQHCGNLAQRKVADVLSAVPTQPNHCSYCFAKLSQVAQDII